MDTTQRHLPRRRVAVVTGANQGLGFALAEGLARRLERNDVVYLTGRDRARVEEARGRIVAAHAEVRPQLLDVGDAGALTQFAAELEAEHGGVDIVLSNHYARVLPDDDPAAVITRYVDTNNLGTTRVLRSFSPLLRAGGRLLVVASSLGLVQELPPHLHDHFDTASVTLDEIDATMRRWRDAVLAGGAEREGWPAFINIPSKVGQVAAVRVLARERRERDLADGTLLAAVCPGMIDTASSRPWFDMSDAQTPAEAAEAVLALALGLGPQPPLYGELVRFGRPLAWRPGSSAALHSRVQARAHC